MGRAGRPDGPSESTSGGAGLEIVEAITEVHGKVILGTTKNHQRRSVPIPRFLADELATHLAGKAPGDLLFTAPEGGVLRNTNFPAPILGPGRGKAGLSGLTPHELWHTAASLALAAGANVKAVADQLDKAFARTNADQMRTPSATWSSRTRPRCPSRSRRNRRLARPKALEPPWRFELQTYALRESADSAG